MIPEYTGILVPNVDNTRCEYLMNSISKQGKPVLLIGEPVSVKVISMMLLCNKIMVFRVRLRL